VCQHECRNKERVLQELGRPNFGFTIHKAVNDGFEDMKKYAAEQKFDFPYLYDGDKQTTAKA
jgi:hypothetical protein